MTATRVRYQEYITTGFLPQPMPATQNTPVLLGEAGLTRLLFHVTCGQLWTVANGSCRLALLCFNSSFAGGEVFWVPLLLPRLLLLVGGFGVLLFGVLLASGGLGADSEKHCTFAMLAAP